ncbi:MAG TPA: fatty acid desaturase family protein [Rhizomicrobium sp.]|jgi:fatty acid desaturase|nr:fatty acid desaturase family protein [Rhizomicrobium sp.]
MNAERFDPTTAFTPEELASVRARSNLDGALCVAHAWIVIGCAMGLYAVWPNPLTFVVTVLVIGSRQLGLAILMHDGAHGVLMRTHNDGVSQWLTAYPIFADTLPYRHYHLAHHRLTQQPDDPDIGLSAPFPITRASLRRKFLRDITGQTGFKQRRAQLRAAFGVPGERLKNFWRKMGGMVIVNLVLLAVLTALGKPHYYLMFWLLPLLTWYMVVLRLRNIAEHAMVPDNDDAMRNARTTYASWIARAFLAPYWVNYHVDHHLLMYVPCYNLPKLHALLLAKGYGDKMEIQQNYSAVLKLAASKAPQAVAA